MLAIVYAVVNFVASTTAAVSAVEVESGKLHDCCKECVAEVAVASLLYPAAGAVE